MTELLINWKTKIDWFNYQDWNFDSSWSFEENEINKIVAKLNGDGCLSKNGIIEKGKKYRLKFKIENYVSGQFYMNVGNIQTEMFCQNGDYTTTISYETTGTNIELMGFDYNSQMDISDIYIEEVGFTNIDISSTDVLLNFSIADINEYEKRKGTYSKTISIPGTKNNNNFFKNIFNINEDSSFNIDIKCDASIQYNNNNIVNGKINLLEIVKNDDAIIYKLIFYGAQLNIFNDIGDDLLEDLDMSDLDHTISYNHLIEQSFFPFSGNTGYTYPWIDYGRESGAFGGFCGNAKDLAPSIGLTVRDFLPALSYEYVLKKIFREYNYELECNLFDEDWFKHIILPYSNSVSELNDWHLTTKIKFLTDNNADYNHLWYFTLPKYHDTFGGNHGIESEYGAYYPFVHIKGVISGIPSYCERNTYGLPRIYLDVDSEGGFDKNLYQQYNFGPWMNSNITVPSGTIYGRANMNNPNDYQVIEKHIPGAYYVKKPGNYKLKIRYHVYNIGFYTQTQSIDPALYLSAMKINTDDFESHFSSSQNDNWFMITGEQTNKQVAKHTTTTGYVEIEHIFYNCKEGDQLFFHFWQSDINAIGAHISNIWVYEELYGDGVTVKGNSLAQKNIKIKDFLTDFLLLYNLYVDVDKENDRKILIKDRNRFYEDGETINWSKKIHYDSDITMKSPTSKQKYFNILKYKDANDYFNKRYNETQDPLNLKYGTKRFLVDNASEGEKKTSLKIFEPTPLIDYNWNGKNGKPQFAISRISKTTYPIDEYKQTYDTNVGSKILFYNPIDIYDNDYSTFSEKTRLLIDAKRTHTCSYGDFSLKYQYAGHILDPYNLSSSTNVDLNFETRLNTGEVWQKTFTGDNINYMTNNNMYNFYYYNQFSQILDVNSRLLTGYFNLNNVDIANLNMSDNVFINGTYFTIEKIHDFNPNSEKLTKVDLLKITNVSKDFEHYIDNPDLISAFSIESEAFDYYNDIDNSINLGSDNLIKSKSALLLTNNSTIESKSVVMNSNEINIASGLTNVTIIGERNMNIDESDVVYINGLKIKDGVLLKNNSLVDGGEIESDGVFNAFKFNEYHINDSGENKGDIFDINIWEIEDGSKID